jgi:hypothetical protein
MHLIHSTHSTYWKSTVGARAVSAVHSVIIARAVHAVFATLCSMEWLHRFAVAAVQPCNCCTTPSYHMSVSATCISLAALFVLACGYQHRQYMHSQYTCHKCRQCEVVSAVHTAQAAISALTYSICCAAHVSICDTCVCGLLLQMLARWLLAVVLSAEHTISVYRW